MPDLTPEQKEHLKMAHRSQERIQETWSLYMMFLSRDMEPADALRRAVDASTVWAEWQDNNEVEPPEIHRQDFSEQITSAMDKMFRHMKANPSSSGELRLMTDEGAGVDAEFVPLAGEPEPEPAAAALPQAQTADAASIPPKTD
jgi:hypothetical protein